MPPDTLYRYPALYALLWVGLVVWGWSYITQSLHQLGYQPAFLHNVNLPFHEAGHVIFGIFGQFIGSLGGTLGQLLVPVICGIALLRRHDTFGASVCLWWFGENFLDIAPYMADARAGELPLLGGNYGKSSPYGFHDWEFILGETGLLAWDKTLAALTLNSGRAIMVLAMVNGVLTSIALETVILSRQMSLGSAFKTACGMSLVSMLAMEAAMNAVDAGVTGGAMLTFWVIPLMLLVGFLTPLPYNYWRLKAHGIACH
mgnify:CR=1 FL=1